MAMFFTANAREKTSDFPTMLKKVKIL